MSFLEHGCRFKCMIVQSLLGYAWINAILGEKECERSVLEDVSGQVPRCIFMFFYGITIITVMIVLPRVFTVFYCTS